MQPNVTADVKLYWIDASGSNSTITLHTLYGAAQSDIESELAFYRTQARAISDCAITGQEVTYKQTEVSSEVAYPQPEVSNENSLVFVFETEHAERYLTIVLPSPKASLFTSDTIPVIDETNDAIAAFAAAIVGVYCTPDGYLATQLLAAVYSREF